MSADVPDVRQTRLDNYVEAYAARTKGMTASEIRALFAVASRPEVVSLAGGMPNLAALPLDTLAVEVADLVARDGQVALQYGSAQGTPQLPHSSRTAETQASFSSSVEPKSEACAPRFSESSQKTQRRHLLGRSSKLSSVRAAMCQDTVNLRRRTHADPELALARRHQDFRR